MRSVIIAAIVLITSVVRVSDAKQLPSFIKKCKRDDPQLNACMKRALMDIRVHIRDGIRELKIPPFMPYVVPTASLTTGWMNASLTNVRAYRSDAYEMDSVRIDFENNPFFVMEYTFPHLHFKADYVLDGKLLQLVIHGEGDLELRLNNTKCSATIEGHKIRKNGKEYMNVDKTDFKIVSTKVDHVRLNNLFRDNPELTDRINQVFLDDRESYSEEMIPLVEQITVAIVEMIFKGVFDTFSLDELFD